MPPAINSTSWPSPNHSARTGAIDSIVLHTTEDLHPRTTRWLCDPDSKVSCHFLILRTGEILQLVEIHHAAWHAGACRYWVWPWWRTDWNGRSIGVELEHIKGQ